MSRYVDLEGLTWDGTPISSKIQEVKTKCGYMSGITTGWLWCDSVPHIDLEEHDKQIKAEAIYDFLRELFPCRYEYNDDCFKCASFKSCLVFIAERIADEMKEGKE